MHAKKSLVSPAVSAALFALILSLLVGSPAQAARPSNDDRASAISVASVPYTDTLDTTEATVGANDGGCGPATVWYQYTPTVTGPHQFDTYGSDYLTFLEVTDEPFTFSASACGEWTDKVDLRINLQAGTTYYLMVGTCCGWGYEVGQVGGGGNLVVNISLAAPVAVQISVDALQLSRTSGGRHTISGTVTCSEAGMIAWVHVDWIRRRGRDVSHGYGYGETRCSTSPTTWESRPEDFPRRFMGPRVEVVATIMACADFVCSQESVTRTLRPTHTPRLSGETFPPLGAPAEASRYEPQASHRLGRPTRQLS